MRKRPPSLRTSASAACSSSLWQTKTPLPTASPSALTTQRPRHREGPRRRHARSPLLAAEPSMRSRRRRAEDGDAAVAQVVGEPGHERHFGPDYHEVDAERRREREQAVCIVRQHRMAASELGDPGLPGAACSPSSSGLCASFHASACSRPPSRRRALSPGEPIQEGGSPRRRRLPREGGRADRRASRLSSSSNRCSKNAQICATCEVDASASFSYPCIREHGVRDARIAVARSFLDVAGPLEPVQETGHTRRCEQQAPGEARRFSRRSSARRGAAGPRSR